MKQSNVRETISKNMSRLRKANNQTQNDIGEILGVHFSTVGDYERGRIFITIDKLIVLCALWKISIDVFCKSDLKIEKIITKQTVTVTEIY